MALSSLLITLPLVLNATVQSEAASEAVKTAVDAVATASVRIEPSGFGLVLDQIEYFILLPMVYLSLLFMVAGIIYRFASIMRAPAAPYSLKIYSSKNESAASAWKDTFLMPQVRRRKPFFWFSLMLFHVAGVILILGHFDILPGISILPETSNHMIGAGLVGVGFTLPLFHFLFRRFKTPIREITVPADFLLLVLVIFLALFGDLISWGNSWTANGFILKKADFAVYFQHLATFNWENPRYLMGGPHYHFVVIHVLLANLFFILVPFSKIVHAFFAMPINLLRRK
jgi:nitrate reductase gamma subunit